MAHEIPSCEKERYVHSSNGSVVYYKRIQLALWSESNLTIGLATNFFQKNLLAYLFLADLNLNLSFQLILQKKVTK